MNLVRLLAIGLALMILPPTEAIACSCAVSTPESVMRQGGIVARVLVLQRTRMEFDDATSYSATAFVQESFSGPFPTRLVEVRWSRSSLHGCSAIGLPSAGQTALVWLFPSTTFPYVGNNQYRVQACADFPSYVDNATEVLDEFARLREQNEGVWVDVFEFYRALRRRPTLSQLQEAFPEVEIVPRNEAPAALRTSWYEIVSWPNDESIRAAVASFRPDQSRFIAFMRGDRVTGGEFR